MLTAVLRGEQPLNKRDMQRLRISFETTPFCNAYRNFYLSIKYFEIGTNSIYFKIYIYIRKNPVESQAPDHFEKMAEGLLYNFHREHSWLELKIKKVITKN